MDIDYVVSPTFAKVHSDKNKFMFVRGPVGSGKSVGCMMHIFLNAMKQRPDEDGVRRSRYLIVRATYPELKTSVLKTWVEWFKDKIRIVMDIPIRCYLNYDLADGTSIDMELFLLAVDSAQNVEKLRSLEVTACHINEASEIERGVFDMIKTRIPRYPARKNFPYLNDKESAAVDPFIIVDYNSVPTDHWLYKIAEEERPEGYSFYTQPPAVLFVDGKYRVNPEAENLWAVGEDYYTDMCKGTDPDFINVNIMNNYGEVRKGRPVFKDYNDALHCAEADGPPLKGVQVVIGMDQGLTPAAVFTQQAPDGSVFIFDEITTEDCSLQEFCNSLLWGKINAEYPQIKDNFVVICDPATVQRSMNDSRAGTEIIKESGLPFRTARTNAFMARKEAVSHFLLMHNKFKMNPKCKMLRKGFISEYKFDEVRSAQSDLFKETPAKNQYSHVHDALQYAMMEYHAGSRKKASVFAMRKHRVASEIGGY